MSFRNCRPLVVIVVLALAGLADAVYLTAEHLAGNTVQCTVVRGCEEVLSSPYATLPGGVPLAALGAAAYFTVFSLAVLALFQYPRAARLIPPLVGLMFIATLWLLYVQAFVLDKFCQYCLLSALVTTGLAAASLWLARGAARKLEYPLRPAEEKGTFRVASGH
ncbi:MAG TPA: vitamin K epoxide reductase family protein [Pyrinomonadaceae bacterium]|jgi:uncharacterized membrane protein|nr:vitamin K epoxide reductase family protein [Pyrinomonadaceae bacterium]